jgi:hypothetical protein
MNCCRGIVSVVRKLAGYVTRFMVSLFLFYKMTHLLRGFLLYGAAGVGSPPAGR